jgi:hypothetical protein
MVSTSIFHFEPIASIRFSNFEKLVLTNLREWVDNEEAKEESGQAELCSTSDRCIARKEGGKGEHRCFGMVVGRAAIRCPPVGVVSVTGEIPDHLLNSTTFSFRVGRR